MSVGVDMTGGDRIADAIRTKLLKTSAAIGTITIGVAAGGRRGPEKNALIARVQADRQRNPWYLDKDTMSAIRFLARGLGAESVDAAGVFRQIGGLLVDAVRKNVAAQRNSSGSTFAELSARYAAFKRRKFGFTHPVLRATGDLLDGLKAVITKQ